MVFYCEDFVPEDGPETVMEYITCPRCGFREAEFQHEVGENFGTLYCPECDRRAADWEESGGMD